MSADNLRDSQLAEILRRLRALETQTPVGFSSVTKGRLRVASAEGLLVEGSQKVTGTLEVSGQLAADGTITLTGDMTVVGGGKITVGDMTIDPSIAGGAITFANGSQVFTDGTTIQVFKGNSVVQVSDSYARIQHGGSVISIGANGVVMNLPTRSRALANNAVVGTVWSDPSGNVYRVVT